MIGSATGQPAAGAVPLWRNRDFMVLWGGQVISTVGTRVTTIAFPLLVLAVTPTTIAGRWRRWAPDLPRCLAYQNGTGGEACEAARGNVDNGPHTLRTDRITTAGG